MLQWKKNFVSTVTLFIVHIAEKKAELILQMNKNELDKLRIAYIKVYGDRWLEVFAKYHWHVIDNEKIKNKSKTG